MGRSRVVDILRNERRREFSELYPTTSNIILIKRFSVSRATIQRLARELGLRKAHAYHAEVQRQNATGRVLSASVREQLRQKAVGRKLTDETKHKILQTKLRNGTILRGARHPSWKGGRPWERFKNPEYLAWRRVVLERDGYICQQCGRQCKKYERGLAAHHIKPYAKFPELRYEISNGLTLCRQCHMHLHGKPLAPKQQVPCACGCGTMIDSIDAYGKVRRYVNHHARRGQPISPSRETETPRSAQG